MAQDLRKLFKEQRENEKFEMRQGHEDRFLSRLDQELPVGKKRGMGPWLRIAASITIVLGITSYLVLNNDGVAVVDDNQKIVDTNIVEKTTISLGDLSPELKKVENYYVANINYELSRLQVSEENKEIVDGYLQRLDELNAAYSDLNKELNEIGPNDQTIEAAITNLQLRLQLMQKLKEKLNQLKTSKNEQESSSII